MNLSRWFPASLASRFALAAAGLAAAALLLTSIASWWLINEQHQRGVEELAATERQFRAAAVGSDLEALAARMSEIADSTILATGLVDSTGRETYLGPFLAGIRQINGIPVQVAFTDFQGTEIASNSGARFSLEQMAWLRRHLQEGRPIAAIFASADGNELVALEPMVYPRTRSPEGAVLYKVNLGDIDVAAPMRLEWGERRAGAGGQDAVSAPVPAPAVFEHLAFRVQGADEAGIGSAPVGLPILHILLIALTLFCVVVVAGLRLARLLTLDLQRLGAFASRLIGSGLSSERAAESGSAEVSHLARSINDMLDRLNEQHMALLREREKLTRLTEVLQLADRKKDDFLAMLGHELRNPLAPIGAGAELLRRMGVDDPRVVRTSEIIARQVGHMTKIISDLLDVSRVTRGLTTLDRTEVDLAEVVAAGIEQVRPLIEARRHALATTMPQERIVVLADRARLVQVLSNLLTNAAKYTAEGGHISVRLSATPQEASIAVQDDGVGISPELMPEIFDLFTQGSRAVDRNQGGLGLGLALVKHLVGLHGGSIAATSDGLGHGSTFTVRLPRVAAPHQPPQHVPEPGHAARRLHILVVDDNIDAAQSLAELLLFEGHTAAVAHDGPATLAYAGRERVDVFILDIGLPGMDGTELARRLRGIPEADGALLIALTGYGQDADRHKSAQAGFDHHLVKPVDPELLRSLLNVPSPVLESRREAQT